MALRIQRHRRLLRDRLEGLNGGAGGWPERGACAGAPQFWPLDAFCTNERMYLTCCLYIGMLCCRFHCCHRSAFMYFLAMRSALPSFPFPPFAFPRSSPTTSPSLLCLSRFSSCLRFTSCGLLITFFAS